WYAPDPNSGARAAATMKAASRAHCGHVRGDRRPPMDTGDPADPSDPAPGPAGRNSRCRSGASRSPLGCTGRDRPAPPAPVVRLGSPPATGSDTLTDLAPEQAAGKTAMTRIMRM